ncbi:MAG: type III-B CRISPR module-associated Cmr3 family protein, partial [Polaromonas sp.]
SLFVRGNLAFGDSGEHGGGIMPPPPSLFAGAFRSALLGKDAAQLTAFLAGGRCTDAALAQCLGTAEAPGDFCISWLSLAADPGGNATPEAISPLPADLLMLGEQFTTLEPRALPEGTQSAGDLPLRATLVSAKQEKPGGGTYLRQTGLIQHLEGKMPANSDAISSKHLYQRDPRLGIGLNAGARTAEEGQIYTTEGFAFSPKDDSFTSTGFLVGIKGAGDLLPAQGLLRLGGDGRSAHYRKVSFTPPPPAKLPGAKSRFRLLLQTPALFSQGWLPEGVTQQGDSYRLQGDGFSARLACAALGRREVISGWDLYQWKPKPAQAAVPAGSVFWFDEFTGDNGKLAAWVQSGLWPQNPDSLQQARRAEGYNRALLGAWN